MWKAPETCNYHCPDDDVEDDVEQEEDETDGSEAGEVEGHCQGQSIRGDGTRLTIVKHICYASCCHRQSEPRPSDMLEAHFPWKMFWSIVQHSIVGKIWGRLRDWSRWTEPSMVNALKMVLKVAEGRPPVGVCWMVIILNSRRSPAIVARFCSIASVIACGWHHGTEVLSREYRLGHRLRIQILIPASSRCCRLCCLYMRGCYHTSISRPPVEQARTLTR